jgi:hypothetical protein
MSLSQRLAWFIRQNLRLRENSKIGKSKRSVAPMLIAGVALLAAVALSVSVESRNSGSLRNAQPSTPHSAPEGASNSTPRSAAVNPNGPLGTSPALAPFAPTVTATKKDDLLTDVDADLKADPGDTLKYTVVIGATGEDATGVTFTDTVDPNTTFVAGSLRTTPLARNDSYSASGNIRITATAPGVLANDSDPDGVGPAITATAGSFLSAQGGNVNLNADGSFTYNPPAGFEGSDSFTYTLNDNEGNTDTATASITVSGMIWFINNTASCPCDGRLTNPFNTLAAFQAVNDGVGNHPSANDNIFVYESATAYVGPVTLRAGQKFIGQDATASLSTISGVTPPAGSDPLPTTNPAAPIVNITSAGNSINVGSNNTLRGFTGGNSLSDIDGSGFGTLTILDVTLNGTGRALNLSTGTLAATFGSITSNSSATTGISLTSVAGSLTTGSTTISDSTGIGISINSSSAAFNFANTSVTSSAATGVSLLTNTGTITFADLDISSDANQRGLLATDNTNTITTTSGTMVTSGAAAVEISRASSTTPLAMVLTSVSTTGGPNGILLRNTSGSFTVNGDGANTSVGGNSTGGTISGMTGADGTTAGNGVYLDTASNVTLRRLTINGTNQNHGIRGINATNFTLEFSTVTGTNGTSVAVDEGSVNFDNLLGTAAITSCVIDGGFEENLNVVNTSGSLNRLTVSGSTFGFNNTANGNNNILIESQNAGTTLNFTLKSSLIKGARADWINVSNNSSSTGDTLIGGPLVADGNTFDNLGANAHAGAAAGGNRVVFGGVGNSTVDIRNNTMKGSKGEAIRIRSTATGAVTGTVNARVRNNTIGVAGTANSGSSESSGIFLFGDGGSDMNAAVTNNSIFQYNNHGISMTFGDEINDGSVFNVTVTGNTISNPGNINTDFNGIQLNNGTVAATDNFTTCADIGGAGVGNIVSNSGSGAIAPNNVDIRLRQRQSTTVRLPGYGGANNDNTAVQTYLTGRNTLVTVNASNTVPTGGGFVGGAACTQPSFASFKPETTTQRDYFARATQPTTPDVNRQTATTPRPGRPEPIAVNPSISQTFSHHAKMVKRNSTTLAGNSLRNTAANHSAVNAVSQPAYAVQDKKPVRGIRVRPTVSNLGGETVSHSVGTLLAGKTVHIQFQVTVNNPYLGGPSVSNQGTVSGSNFSSVLTDDPAVGGSNDPTQTLIVATPNISIADAQANEPASGSAPMLFTISLSSPAPAGGASVHYQTADQAPGAGHAVAGVDYTAVPDTVLNFAAGEQFKTVSVNILADGSGPEPDETFLVNLSNPTNALIADNQAIGTIKQGNAAGTFLISELRTSGPAGAGDDFVEVYNNSDTPLMVAASDASAGYGLFKMGTDCNATPILIGTIPNGTVIPARGHYLFTGSAYSLANYGGTGAAAGNLTLSADIESDGNVGIFNTSSVANLSSVTRLDAVGFGSNTGGNCDLLREGATLPSLGGSVLEHSYVRDECGKKGNPAIFGPCPTGGLPKDTNVNNDDFIFVDTAGTVTPAGQRLGAPGPQNLANPLVRNSTILALLLDANIGAPSPPNRVRDLTPSPPNATNGTLSIRRRFVNNTGGSVTRLRFRIVDISSLAVPGGIADLRALTSTNVTVNGITDGNTCLASNGVATTPCTVTVLGTTLEQPPTQNLGGAHNSTLSAGAITLATPLAPGASINLQFLLGVQQTGSFKFFFNIEALP